MLQRLTVSAAAVALVSVAVLAAPMVAAHESSQLPRADSSRRVCTQQYDPVCARRGTSYRTFGNACEAQVAGYFVDHKGRCGFSRNDRSRNDPPVICTREYKPVCGLGRNGRKTFGNACEAQAAGYRIVHGGRC